MKQNKLLFSKRESAIYGITKIIDYIRSGLPSETHKMLHL